MSKMSAGLFLAATALLAQTDMAVADPWPPASVRIVIGNPPGGPPDTLARLVGQQLAINHKASFVVENKVGGALTLSKVEVFRGLSLIHI